MLAVDMVEAAASGHPGLPLGAAPMAWTVWSRFLRHDGTAPSWPDRDRFVLSAGHGSALLYGLLYLFDYGLEIEDLEQFRQLGSRTPGHPEVGHTPASRSRQDRSGRVWRTPLAWRWLNEWRPPAATPPTMSSSITARS